MHEILDKLNTQARAASIFRQDYGVSREDALYLFTWQREGEYHKRRPPDDFSLAMLLPQDHDIFFFLKVSHEVIPAYAEESLAKQVVENLLFMFGAHRDFLSLADDVGHNCFSSWPAVRELSDTSFCCCGNII